MPLDSAVYRDALARFPSGICIVTTLDGGARPWGFTASAFSALSLDPPLILVCLDRRADSHDAFSATDRFAVSILASHQLGLAMRFATKSIEKFDGVATDEGSDTGVPLIPEAVVHLECQMERTLAVGDHTILVGEVVNALVGGGEPLVHNNRHYGVFREQAPDRPE